MKIQTIVNWVPRVIAILFILFLFVFSLDVFSSNGNAMQKAAGFLITNIPTAIFILLLLFTWKFEIFGGILFILAAVEFTMYFHTYKGMDRFLLISAPLFLSGIIFLINGIKNRRHGG